MIHIARWKVILTIVVCLLGLGYAAPNLLSAKALETLPTWVPNKHINLGLDLRGGTHAVLEVQTGVVVEERLETIRDDLRIGLRTAKPRIGYRGLAARAGYVTVHVSDATETRRAVKIAKSRLDGVNIDASANRIRISLTEQTRRELVTTTVEHAIERLRARFDELGLKNTSIQRQGANRIIVEAAGVEDANTIYGALPPARLSFHLMCPGRAVSGKVPEGCARLPSKQLDDVLSGNRR